MWPAFRAVLPEGDFRDWAKIEAWARRHRPPPGGVACGPPLRHWRLVTAQATGADTGRTPRRSVPVGQRSVQSRLAVAHPCIQMARAERVVVEHPRADGDPLCIDAPLRTSGRVGAWPDLARTHHPRTSRPGLPSLTRRWSRPPVCTTAAWRGDRRRGRSTQGRGSGWHRSLIREGGYESGSESSSALASRSPLIIFLW